MNGLCVAILAVVICAGNMVVHVVLWARTGHGFTVCDSVVQVYNSLLSFFPKKIIFIYLFIVFIVTPI
jgi:hypothetical protein